MLFIIVFASCVALYFYLMHRDNMDYYKAYGRKEEEIAEWLRKRKWYLAFRDNIQQGILNKYRLDDGSIQFNEDIDKEIEETLNEVLSGRFDKQTISAAFFWADTAEGTKYWGKCEKQFLKWYFGQIF